MRQYFNRKQTAAIPLTVLAVTLSLWLTGCTKEEAQNAPSSPSDPAAGTKAADGTINPSANAPVAGNPPMMGGSDNPMAPLTPSPDLDKKIADAEKGGDKKAIAVAYTARGDFRQHDDNAGARVKYRAALADFRKALKADPKNARAKQFKETIEGIYKQMGRPVPTGE